MLPSPNPRACFLAGALNINVDKQHPVIFSHYHIPFRSWQEPITPTPLLEALPPMHVNRVSCMDWIGLDWIELDWAGTLVNLEH